MLLPVLSSFNFGHCSMFIMLDEMIYIALLCPICLKLIPCTWMYYMTYHFLLSSSSTDLSKLMSHTMTSQIGGWALSCMLLCKQGISLNSQGRARLRHVWLGWPKKFSAVLPFRWQIRKCSKDTDSVLLLYCLTITWCIWMSNWSSHA
jgi:hypothetical protein